MRKFLTIGTLALMMFGLLFFEFGQSGRLPFEPKVLAASGFILLTAYTIGEVVQRFGPPKLVGYIITGVLFGPHLTPLIFGEGTPTLFGTDVVEDLSLINALAQGLIGLTAGGELLVQQLRQDARTIAFTLTFETLITFALVAAAVAGLAFLYPDALPFLAGGGTGGILAALLLFGSLSVGTSPSTTLAVITETGAQGPLKRATLGLVVAKDVSTVILFLTCLAVAASLTNPEAGGFSASSLLLIAEELGGAIAIGAVLGCLMWVYLRWVRAEMLLFVAAVVFVGMYVAKQLHVEALLMFIMAGFFIANKIPLRLWAWLRGTLLRRPYSAERLAEEEKLDLGHFLIHELERLSLPTFVVFFTIAAAKLQLAALKDFWIIALIYVVLRAIGLFAGTQLGVKLANSPEIIKKRLWMGMFPQAGVTLTLASLATDKIPWAVDFQTIIMATILGNIVVGPTLLKVALTQAGEVQTGANAPPSQGHGKAHGHESDVHLAPHAAPQAPDLPASALELDQLKLNKEFGRRQAERLAASFRTPGFSSDDLNAPLLRLRRRLLRVVATVERGYLRERNQAINQHLREISDAALASVQLTVQRIEQEADFAHELGDAPASSLEGLPTFRDRARLKAILREGKADLALRVQRVVAQLLQDFPSSARAENALIAMLEQVEAAVEFEEPVVHAPQEPERFMAVPGDSFYAQSIKALKRLGRAAGGFRSREVDLFLLSRFYIELPTPGFLVHLADQLGAQHRYMWMKARILYALTDAVYQEALRFLDDAPLAHADHSAKPNDVDAAAASTDAIARLRDPDEVIQALESALRAEPLPIHPGEAQPAAIDQLAQFLRKRLDDLREEVDLSMQDLDTFHDDVRTHAKEILARPYGEFVDACAIAGTFELRKGQFRASRLFDDNRHKRQIMLDTLRNWATYNRGLAGRFLVELDIASLHADLRQVLADTLRVAEDQLLSAMCYYPIELGERVDEIRAQLDLALIDGADPDEIRRSIVKQRALLLAFIHSNALADMEEAQQSRRFAEILARHLESLGRLTEEARDSVLVLPVDLLANNETTGLPASVDLLDIPARAMLRELFDREIAVQLSDIELRLNALIDETSRGLMELGHIIGFNLDAAMSELETPGQELDWPRTSQLAPTPAVQRRLAPQEPLRDDQGRLTYAGLKLPREFAIGGLDRAIERIDALVHHVDDEGEAIKALILNETVKQAREARRLILEGDAGAIRLFLTQRDIRSSTSRAAATSSTLLARARGGAQRILHTLTAPFRQPAVSDLQRQLQLERGLAGDIEVDAAHVTTFLDVWNREDLPNIYRRLFSPTPNEVAEFFVGRSELLDRFNRAVDQWLHGSFTAISLIGEPGSGRSSFIDHTLRSRLQGLAVYRRRLTHTIRNEGALVEEFGVIAGGRRNLDLESLKATIRSRKERSVVIIEDAENLFIRALDGLTTIEHFLQLVTETGDRILWVVCIDQHAWDYLNMVVHIGQHFTHPLTLRPFNRVEVEDLILTRHRMSGFDLRFEHPLTGLQRLRALLSTSRAASVDDQRTLARAAFFDALHTASHGNPMMAIFLWLRAIQAQEDDDNTLTVRPLSPPQLHLLHTLDDTRLLVLANLILHNGLTVPEYAAIFRVDNNKALAVLQHLFNLRLLHLVPGTENTYRLRQILYQPIARHLIARNML